MTTVVPKNLQLMVGRLANMQRTVIRARPQSNDTAEAGQTMHFRLPTNTLVDLHNLILAGVFQVKDDYIRGGPTNMQEIIERLDLVVNGQVISGNNNDYGMLYHILSEHMADPDWFSAGEFNKSGDNKTTATMGSSTNEQRTILKNQANQAPTSGITDTTNTSSNVSNMSYSGGDSGSTGSLPKALPFAIGGFLGFLGGSYVRYIDTAVLGPVEIRMRLQPNSVLWLGESSSTNNAGKPNNTWYRSSGGTSSYAAIGDGYEIKQAYLFMDTISFVDDFYRALLARRLETGTMLTIPYHNFFSFSKAINSSSDTMTFNLATQSLDMLAVVMRDQKYTNRYAKAWNQWTNNSSYFSSLSLDYDDHYKGDTTYQFQVNNLLVPTWPVSVEEAYPLTRAALDLASDYSGSGGNVRRLWDYKWGRFLFAQAFKHHAEAEKIISGLDTRGASSNMSFTVNNSQAGSSTSTSDSSTLNAIITVFAMTTSTLEVGAGQNVTVIF